MRISEIVHVLEQPATNPCADLKMWIGKNKEGIHKDHLVYFVNNSLAQPKGTQLQRHSPCNPWSWPSGAPNSFLQRQVKDSVVLYCTEQPNSAIHLLLHLNLLYIYFALLGSKAREGCLGAPASPWCGCAWSTTAQTRLSSITECVYGQNCFISFRDLGPSSPVKSPPLTSLNKEQGFSSPSQEQALSTVQKIWRNCLEFAFQTILPLGQEGRLTLSFPSKGKVYTGWSPKRKIFFNIKSLIQLVSIPEVSFLQHTQVSITECKDLSLCYTAASSQFNGDCQVFCRVWSFGPEALLMLKVSEVFGCLW